MTSVTGVGPDLNGLAARAGTRRAGLDAATYVIESVRNPDVFTAPGFDNVRMPRLEVSEAELDALVAFLLADRP